MTFAFFSRSGFTSALPTASHACPDLLLVEGLTQAADEAPNAAQLVADLAGRNVRA